MKYLLPLAPLVFMVAAGCGDDKRAEVTGSVTVAGKGPLTGGSITFVAADDRKRVASGVIKADGTYRVPDAPVGECKVSVDNSHFDPANRKAGMGVPGGMSGPPGMKGAPAIAGAKGPSADSKTKMGAAPKEVGGTGEMGTAESANAKFVKIDVSYTSPTNSPLRATVGTGSNSVNFEVK